MEQSILNSVKKLLGITPRYDVFDDDILIHVNASLVVLAQLGVESAANVYVSDDTTHWNDLNIPADQLQIVKSYLPLKVRLLFDPPATSFLIEAVEKQLVEYEWRINVLRETTAVGGLF
jgi:hypothetical protein